VFELLFETQVVGLDLAVLVGAAFVATSLPTLWWAMAGATSSKAANHLRSTTTVDLHELLLTKSAEERVVGPLAASLARRFRRISPTGLIASVERKIAVAGSPHRWPLERVLATKLIGGAMGVALVSVLLLGEVNFRNLGLAAVILYTSYQAPDLMLGRTGSIRQEEVQRSLADAIDQVTISVEAGLGFDAAISRYADTGSGALAEEFSRVLQDLQLGLGRRAAFDGLLDRTDVVDLRRFVLALRQADEHGIPLAQVLRAQSGELRDLRRQRAETKAAAIPVKVIFPMIFCILPTLFIVILGPAVFRISDTFGG